jgi:cation diffusion facilitator CzcD-associated flavoprotein CzcO
MTPSSQMDADADGVVDVIIIGSGISGMTVAIDMLRLNNKRRFLILEKGHRVGGTWSDNEYPGCCCDVWSHLYSLSFCPNPDWSREYPTQPEIQRYLAGVARTYDLDEHTIFETAVESCEFDLDTGTWTTTTRRTKDASTQIYRSRFVVSAVGQLNQPAYPKLSGMENFQGAVMHSARWDKTVDLRGKKVAVIGNGACAPESSLRMHSETY